MDTVKKCLNIFCLMLSEIKVNSRKMAEATQSGFVTATDLADYLACKGVPFRTAHEVVGRIVSSCLQKNMNLWDMSFEEFKRFSPDIEADVMNSLTIDSSINSRKCIGGTARQVVKRAIGKAKKELLKGKKFLGKVERTVRK